MLGNNLNVIQDFKHNTINGHECVDLGLCSGQRWAACNVGASSPEEYGDYFSWGELETKVRFSDINSRTYLKKIDIDISGSWKYDVVFEQWGSGWRLPKLEDFQELLEECEWQLFNCKGVDGYKVIGPNGNFIFLPSAGFKAGTHLYDEGKVGLYWSSLPSDFDNGFSFSLNCEGGTPEVILNARFNGLSVRAVVDE